jgi:recombination protein RecA
MAVKKESARIDISQLKPAEIRKLILSKDSGGVIFGKEEIEEQCTLIKIRTNMPTYDYIGGGGFTEGRWTSIVGNPSACKTTTALQVIPAIHKHQSVQGDFRYTAYIDPEGSFDQKYATGHGVDLSRVIIIRKKVLEDVFEYVAELIQKGIVGSIVFDSLDGLVPRKTDDNSWANTMGSLAGALSAHLPNLFNITMDNKVTVICIRQARVKMQTVSKGEIITFSGGKAFEHFQDAIVITKRLSNLNMSYTPIQIKAHKTRSHRMGLILDAPLGVNGIDRIRDMVTIATNHGLIEVAGGGWTTFGEFRCQGADKFVEYVRENSNVQVELYNRVYNEVIDVANVVGVSNTIGEDITIAEEVEGA